MSPQPPSAVELEIARRFDQEHARVCLQPQASGLAGRLRLWREERLVRNALKVAGEPGLILDVACGVGRFWPVLAEHSNRVILATDPSQDILEHARIHHSQSLLKRVKTFQSSAFSIGLSANAVDCIFCMQLFQHFASPEHRLQMLAEFYRVSRDTVIMAVRLDGPFKGAQGAGDQPQPGKTEVEKQFRQAGFRILSHQDLLPGCARTRIYVLGKTG